MIRFNIIKTSKITNDPISNANYSFIKYHDKVHFALFRLLGTNSIFFMIRSVFQSKIILSNVFLTLNQIISTICLTLYLSDILEIIHTSINAKFESKKEIRRTNIEFIKKADKSEQNSSFKSLDKGSNSFQKVNYIVKRNTISQTVKSLEYNREIMKAIEMTTNRLTLDKVGKNIFYLLENSISHFKLIFYQIIIVSLQNNPFLTLILIGTTEVIAFSFIIYFGIVKSFYSSKFFLFSRLNQSIAILMMTLITFIIAID